MSFSKKQPKIGCLLLQLERLRIEKEMLLAAIAERFSIEDWTDPRKGITELEAHLAALTKAKGGE